MLRRRTALIVAAALALPAAIVGVAWSVQESREVAAGEVAAAELQDARASVVRLVDEGHAARADLGERIAEARDVTRAGRTAERGVMQALQEALSTAESHRRAEAPRVPPADAGPAALADARSAARDWTGELTWMSGELARNIAAAEKSQQEFRQAQEARRERERQQAARAGREPASRHEPAPPGTLPEARDALRQAVTDLPPLVEDAGFTIDWAEQAGVPGDLVSRLRARLGEAQEALADGEAVAGSGELGVVAGAARRLDAAFAALEEASWRARDAGADGTNGRLSRAELCLASHSPEGLRQYLRCDAAEAWRRLGAEFEQEFGVPLYAEYGYRAYDLQLWAMAVYGAGQAAEPGTSNHGWGEAVDLQDDAGWGFGGEYHEWLRAHAPAYGWDNPPWARQGNGREEPWHWEYGTS
ncbi:M15 family metallopeptidase [Myceligenerans crystallogenes]|uniref:D-alanyl-D-alanine carboxypeptidase-like core domain-containing protein n=1 Tax=Myceligenerans crystallogenes TaxID=316335 RepID=A0ABN2NEA6_9MICO